MISTSDNKKINERPPLFSLPRARATDPMTSHAAAERKKSSGSVRDDHRRITRALTAYGPMPGKKIAERADMTQIEVMRRMKELEDLGWVAKTGAKVDRQNVYSATAAGVEVVEG